MIRNKKKVVTRLTVVLCLLLVLISSPKVFAHIGNWSSGFAYDLNGYSSIGTTNGQQLVVYDFFVERATGDLIGYEQKFLDYGQSHSTGFWGQPFLDRQGLIFTSRSDAVHSPWFNP